MSEKREMLSLAPRGDPSANNVGKERRRRCCCCCFCFFFVFFLFLFVRLPQLGTSLLLLSSLSLVCGFVEPVALALALALATAAAAAAALALVPIVVRR